MKELGVNYIGYFNEPCGLTEASISNVKALQSVGVRVNVISYLFSHKRDVYEDDVNASPNKYPINIFHINLGTIKEFVKKTGKKQFKNSYNIAFWMWEFEEIPENIVPYMAMFDEIWTASDFCVDIFSKKAHCPVVCMPHPIEIPKSGLSRKELNLKEDNFVFLTIFDSHSTILRKNPYAVIEAFKNAFGFNNEDVALVIKCIGLDDFPDEKKKFASILKDATNIKLIDERISRRELTGLIENSDSLISLHRSEGFGLTLAEAMFFKKPVIATGYSGNRVFMNKDNSFLVDYCLKPLESSIGMLKKGFIAADANIMDASKKMKEVYENNSKVIDIATNGQKDVLNNLSYITIGNTMKQRLLELKITQKKSFFKGLLLRFK